MHIEKNMSKNIFNTDMHVKGKTKDNIKTIMNITLFYHRKNIQLVFERSWVAKPKASFALEKNVQLLIY
jgi:hypothetical protein